MFNFFNFIGDMWDNLWKLIQNTLNNIGILLDTINSINGLPTFLFTLVPGAIGSCIVAVSAIGIAKLLIGWGNS